MNIDALLVPVPKTSKPPALPVDQFEFVVDRSARRIATGLPATTLLSSLFSGKETLRVQTNRPFTMDTRVSLPDTTMKSLHEVSCAARIEGAVDATHEAAKRFLETALAADFKFEALIARVLASSLNQYGSSIGGAFIHAMRQPKGHDLLQAALTAAMQGAGLPVKHITIAPILRDDRSALAFEDQGNPLKVQTSGTLESHRVGYKARLIWGNSDEHVAGRLTYEGTVEGMTEGSSLGRRMVVGQTQPLEHWFRALLAEALSREEWPAIVAGDEPMRRRVIQVVSQSLGMGTGRVVDTLVVYPVAEAHAAGLAEGSTKFTAHYAITGVKGSGIEVEHAIRYSLVDRDRWVAQKSPDPQTFFKQQVIEAAKSFLIDKRFEDVVRLFLDGAIGERTFRDGIASRVGPAVKSIGYRLDSVATILAIPEMDFIHGRMVHVAEQCYGLADPHVEPALRVETRVRVRQQDEGGSQFARALALYDNFEARVSGDIEQSVRSRLRNVSALSYYSSSYVNGVRTIRDVMTGEWHSLAGDADSFSVDLNTAINDSLARQFGLEAVEFRIVPGADPLIERMKQLNERSTTYRFDLKFDYGAPETAITVKALATLFIGSISPEHWSSFHLNAKRMSLEEHIDKIRETLEDTLRLMESIVISTPPEQMQHVEVKQRIVELFEHRTNEELGLVVRLFPLQITIVRPSAGQITAMEIEALKLELAKLFERRIELDEASGYGDTREKLTARIEAVKRELTVAARQQEENLQRMQSVRIEQDRRTGRLLERPNNSSLSSS